MLLKQSSGDMTATMLNMRRFILRESLYRRSDR
jgi:hypothetical protein